ncbi:retina development in camera-type eye [Branchiostoma belcheri]|nr:retina development in camera-type eye [Branchiostoma belcheri]
MASVDGRRAAVSRAEAGEHGGGGLPHDRAGVAATGGRQGGQGQRAHVTYQGVKNKLVFLAVRRAGEEEERRRQTKVDYSWLACTSARSRPRYQMSQMDRLELETMCSQVRPEESGDVIVRFRDRLYPEMPPQEIPLVLRAVIRQVFQRRNPAPDSWARRLRSQSMILWTTQSSARVHPSSRESSGEETGIEMDARRVYSLPDFTAKSVAQLPV